MENPTSRLERLEQGLYSLGSFMEKNPMIVAGSAMIAFSLYGLSRGIASDASSFQQPAIMFGKYLMRLGDFSVYSGVAGSIFFYLGLRKRIDYVKSQIQELMEQQKEQAEDGREFQKDLFGGPTE